MDLHLHLDSSSDDVDEGVVHDILRLLRQVNSKMEGIHVSLESLTAAVAENTSASDSAIALVDGLVQELQDALANKADPSAVQALVDQLKANTSELSKAVTDNTPAAAPAGGGQNTDPGTGVPADPTPADPAPVDPGPQG